MAAARRICAALRAAGVEVWFDQDALVGGDAWDAKIRGQIAACALFVPVISASTQARGEGYFRLEWKLAVDRSHLMAHDQPFLLPVVIDATPDASARVPAEFRAVQWTRLPGGETPAAFVARVKALLGGSVVGSVVDREPDLRSDQPSPFAPKLPRRRAFLFATAVAVVAIAVAVLVTRQPATSEADQLVRQARELMYDPDSARNEFALAENLLKRATDLAPASGAAWGASALLNQYFHNRTYDQNKQRLVRAQAEADKALRLEPRNADALLALGLNRAELGEKDQARDYVARAHASDPQNFKVILAQMEQISEDSVRVKFLLDAAGTVPRPAELFYYAAVKSRWKGRFESARVACERAIAAQPFWRAFVERAWIEYLQTADPAKTDAWLDRVPERKRDEPRVALIRYQVAMLRRDGAAAIRVLTALAADYLEDSYVIGPKAYLLAQAHELAGQPQQAGEQWRLAERIARDARGYFGRSASCAGSEGGGRCVCRRRTTQRLFQCYCYYGAGLRHGG